MANHAAPVRAADTLRPTLIVDLDSLSGELVPWTPPVVVDGEIVTHRPAAHWAVAR